MSFSMPAARRYVCAAMSVNVRRLLDERGLSQAWLADKSGCSASSVWLVARGELGGRGPTVAHAALMALALGVTLDELCGLDELRARMREEEE